MKCGRTTHLYEWPIRRPRVFCASLSDWLDDEVPIEWLADLLKLIHDTPNLDWLLLTKRPQNFWRRVTEALCQSRVGLIDRAKGNEGVAKAASWAHFWKGGGMTPENVWIGTTVEDQQRADERIPELLKIPARVRFLSCEPLLGPVDLEKITIGWESMRGYDRRVFRNSLESREPWGQDSGIHWVIAGGESGPGARPMHPDWARSLRDQCEAAGVAYHFKQWGEWAPWPETMTKEQLRSDRQKHALDERFGLWRVGKKAAGRLLDGREHNEFPEVQ